MGDDTETQGLPETDHYNGLHGLKPGVETYSTLSFSAYLNVLQRIGIFKYLLRRAIIKHKETCKQRNSTLYHGHQCTNITIGEIIGLLGIMMRISIETWKMVGYPSFFVEDPMIHLGYGYAVQLRGYDAWTKDIMTLIRFKQIHSAFHPEVGTTFCGDKFNQLCYFICMFNDKAKIIFVLG